MNLSPYAIEQITPFILGEKLTPYRNGKLLVSLFNKYGCRDVYDGGMPDIGKKSGQLPSRTEYVQKRLRDLTGKEELRSLLGQILNEAEDKKAMADAMNKILEPESFSVLEDNGKLRITGGDIVKRRQVATEATFQNIEKKVLDALSKARVSIKVAMAWFTNETIRDKLLEKVKEGLDVYIAIFDDGINKKHGVDLTGIPHKRIRGSKGGLMHNKFCVIDNHVVLTGSYNWSNNAETRNDENVSTIDNPDQASDYSVEFRRLIS